MKRSGFTLIELLIVIAIIGILAAVLIPNLLAARTASQESAVQAHTNQVFTQATAVLSVDSTATVASVSGLMADCSVPVAIDDWGWDSVPGAMPTCSVAPNASGNNFLVTATTDSGATFINGERQP